MPIWPTVTGYKSSSFAKIPLFKKHLVTLCKVVGQQARHVDTGETG